MFPIGHLNKEEVRKLAHKFDLPTKDRKDSQGICFLGKFKFRDFLAHHLGTKPGDFIEFETEKKLGTHNGHFYYTIGQRKDIKLSGGPWYVVKKDFNKNIVYLSCNYEIIETPRKLFEVASFNWITVPKKENLLVKLRHRATPQRCILKLTNTNGIVTLENKDQGIANGQFAVFYDDNICLGTGVIQ